MVAAVNSNGIGDLISLVAQFPGADLDESQSLLQQAKQGLEGPEIPEQTALDHMNAKAEKFNGLSKKRWWWWTFHSSMGRECVTQLKEEVQIRGIFLNYIKYVSSLTDRVALAGSAKIYKLQRDVDTITTERNVKQTRIVQLNRKITAENAAKVKLTNDKAVVDAQLADKQKELEKVRKDFEVIAREKEQLSKKLQEYEHRLSQSERVQQKTQAQQQELQSQLQSQQDAVERLSKIAEDVQQERDTLLADMPKVVASHSLALSRKDAAIKRLEHLNRAIIIVCAIIGLAVAIFGTFRPSANCEI